MESKQCYECLITLILLLQAFEVLKGQMSAKFEHTHTDGTKVGFMLPSGKKVLYTFKDRSTVKVSINFVLKAF